MSFSNDVKAEAVAEMPKARHCLISELLAFLLHIGKLKCEKNVSEIVVESENEIILRKCFTIFQKTYNIVGVSIETRQLRGKPVFSFRITSEEIIGKVIRDLKLEGASGKNLNDCTADEKLLARECCRRAFLRGCFLCAGSVSAPDKSNHLEISDSNEERAAALQALLKSMGIEAGVVLRKRSFVVYVKDGDQISDVLTMIGANKAVLAFWEGRVVKDVRNSVNRKVNCETANLNKTASAAYSQIEDIRILQRHRRLGSLPEQLQEAARIRLETPDASLSELGKMLDPPVSKSGINHRLKKLHDYAEELRVSKEEDYGFKDDDGSDTDRP